MKKLLSMVLLFSLFLTFACDSGPKEDTATTTADSAQEAVTDAATESAPAVATENVKSAAPPVNQDTESRLISFFKSKFGTRLPGNTNVKLGEFKSSNIKGIDEGSFIVDIPGRGEQPIPMLISQDRKYLIIGASEPTNLGDFKASGMPGLRQGTLDFGRQQIPVLISDDGSQLIVGEILDSTVDPLQEIVSKISMDNVPLKGKADAPITVVEYSDFQCPFCKRGSDMLPGLLEEYDGKIKIVFKQFPLPNHNWAKPSSIASLCAFEQGNDEFWAFHDMVFAKQKEISLQNSTDKFNEIAKEIGLDQSKFDACISSGENAARVDAEMQEGQLIGISSTPTFVVDGLIVPGADLQSIKNAIDSRM
jgi:protein-disulfide isomerase